jgi:DNA-binding CsgD family transcriptional regulator
MRLVAMMSVVNKDPKAMNDSQSIINALIRSDLGNYYIYDADHLKIIFSNSQLKKALGFTETSTKQDIESHLREFCHVDDYERIKARLDIDRHHKEWMGCYRLLDQNGSVHWVMEANTRIESVQNSGRVNDLKLISGVIIILPCRHDFHQGVSLMLKQDFDQQTPCINKLTKQEVRIIKLIAMGHSYMEISKMLYIQPTTVNTHRRNILKKLGLRNIAQIAFYAAEKGII